MKAIPRAILNLPMAAAVAALVVASGAGISGAQAQSPPSPPGAVAPATCEVPAELTTSDHELVKVAQAVKEKRKLDILVVGTGSSTLAGADGYVAAYPKRLEQALTKKLPGVSVIVSSELMARRTAEDIAEDLRKLATERKPNLVIWQTGTVDAMRNVHPDDFRIALESGVEALQEAGADVILMNMQYSPRTETMISVVPYMDTMRMTSQQLGVPLFDRFAIMHHWSETGEFDLFGATRDFSLAKRVHDCIGRALALLVIDAAKLNPAELQVPR